MADVDGAYEARQDAPVPREPVAPATAVGSKRPHTHVSAGAEDAAAVSSALAPPSIPAASGMGGMGGGRTGATPSGKGSRLSLPKPPAPLADATNRQNTIHLTEIDD